MNLPRLFSVIFLAVIYSFCNSCADAPEKKLTKHYSDEMLTGVKKISDQYRNRDTGFYLIDSLYKTFPYISAADKFRNYDFKRNLFEIIRHGGDRSYDTAITYLDSMIAVVEDNGLEKELASEYKKAFNTRGEYYTRRKRYINAIRDITRCKQLNEQDKDTCLVAENTKTLSSIAIQQTNFPLAADLIKEAVVSAGSCKKDSDYFIRMQRYLDDLGYVYSHFNLDSSLKYHLAAEKFVKENKQLMQADTLFPYIALENIYGNISYTYVQVKKYQQADFYARELLKIHDSIIHDSLKLSVAHYLMALACLKNGRLEEAESMAQKSSLQIHKLDSNFVVDLLTIKADIASQKKQYKLEADYRKQLGKIHDAVLKTAIKVLINNPLIEYEQLDKKYQVELLVKESQNQRSKARAAIAIGILLTLIAAIFLYFLSRLRTVMKKRSVLYHQLMKTMEEKEIAEKQLIEKELFSQEMRLQMEFNEAIIQQRRQISDDMHDELSSSLAALKFYVEDMKQRAAGTASEQTLSDIVEEVSTMYQNARSYMHSLKTNNWETRFSLTGFLKEIQQKFSEKGLMVVKLNLDEAGIKSLLSTRQHDQLYHIIREAISNVIKHANATELLISVGFKKNFCNIVIADNGIGFNKEKIQYGIGIQSIKNRVKDLEGDIKIESLTKGTKISVAFPLH